jgi:hypothetical protein
VNCFQLSRLSLTRQFKIESARYGTNLHAVSTVGRVSLRLSNAVLVIAFVARCVAFAQSIDSSYLPEVDFSKYHTYKWVTIQDRQHPDPNKDAQIKQLIDRQLAAKGLTKTDGVADLSVGYQVALSKTETWKTYENWTSTILLDDNFATRKKVTINSGTLVLDMYDTAAKKLVWTGSVTKTIDTSDAPANPEQKQKTVAKAVQALLKNYPPK